jgi:hypothetical protein
LGESSIEVKLLNFFAPLRLCESELLFSGSSVMVNPRRVNGRTIYGDGVGAFFAREPRTVYRFRTPAR